jgi:acetyl-CoA C-acetyltransferase
MGRVRDAVICEPLRTPIGCFGGALRDVPAADLASAVVRELIARSRLPPEEIDDVILGQCYPNGEAPAIGRVVALDTELPVEIGGLQIDRRCGSGLQAVIYGAMQVQTGAAELVLAGGVESMSQAEYYSTDVRWGTNGRPANLYDRLARGRVTAGGRHHQIENGMIETAENLRRQFGISRREQDELALRSHERAVAAQRDGRLAEEIVPVTLTQGSTTVVVEHDEQPRTDTSLEALERLPAVLSTLDGEATVTAGNASGQNDGAAVCIVTSTECARRLNLRPVARLLAWAHVGVPPETMGIGPVPASKRALDRAGLKLANMDLIECNEAFAAQVLACARLWELEKDDYDRLNVNGSGIALGHPVGATGGRILATLLRELARRGGRFGLETMCIGGGQGLAAVFENLTLVS